MAAIIPGLEFPMKTFAHQVGEVLGRLLYGNGREISPELGTFGIFEFFQ